ncbi:hypothetical protein Hypma_001595 [Hypsizygus marmoreus]|uniref:BTB domain-containing protein n=1 Tax=Hypsizygus marmoreus TaxID=39966 RepID=A0A369J5W5_HYPMA|nr:hypothetical protein Hypma_001595 [Hypsizygus marmoreus]
MSFETLNSGLDELAEAQTPSMPSTPLFPSWTATADTNTEDEGIPAGVTKDEKYYLDMVIFLVEDRLFMVPKYHFAKTTDFFSPLFQGDGIVRLDDVSKADFTALLKLFYPLYLESPVLLTQDEWVSILKLATKWTMIDIRQMAIIHLPESETMPPVDRIVLAKSCSVVEWLQPAYTKLVQRPESMSVKEAENLGLDVAIKLCRVQEDCIRRRIYGFGNYASTNTQPSSNEKAICRLFTKELEERTALLDPIERVLLARTYGVAQWLRSAYVELVERREPISLEEAQKLGPESAFSLFQARMEFSRGQYNYSNYVVDYMGAIKKEFEEELQRVDTESNKYRPRPLTPPTPVPNSASRPGGAGKKKKIRR